MSNLQEFLLEASVEDCIKEILVSERLKGNGFKIKAMSNEQYKRFQKLCISQKNGKRHFNDSKMKEMMLIECVVEPNFSDAAWIQKAGCATPEQLLNKVLLPGEIERIVGEISELSGFGQDLEQAVEEAKNC
ncbi:MAG: phage tail assembly chaperone [Bradymonadia bacterium]|jgi:hypothetical protein